MKKTIVQKGGMKSSNWAKGGMHQERLGTTDVAVVRTISKEKE